MARQPFPRTDRSHRSGDPGRPRAGAEGHRRRDRAGHRQRPARLRDLARSPGSRASAVDAALPAPAQGTPRRTRRTAGPGDRQEPRRCQGRRVARHRGGRTRRQRGQPDDGRDGGKRRPRDRHRQLDPAPRRVRRDHPVQFPGDDPAVDVPTGHRLRQHLRPQALRTGSADTQPPRRAVPRGRRAEGRAAGDPWRPRAGRCPPHPPGHPGDFLRRLGRRRPARVPHRHRAPEAGAGLRRGEEPHGDPPRREQGPGPRQPGRRQLRRRRPALHGDQRGGVRRRGARVDSRAGRADGRPAPRPLAGPGRRLWSADQSAGAPARAAPDRRRQGGRRRVPARRLAVPGRRLSQRQLARSHPVPRSDAEDGPVPRGDLRPGAGLPGGRYPGRGDRPGQRQSLWQRHQPVHPLRRRRSALPARGAGRPGGDQRADPGTAAVLLLHRLEGLLLRRPARLWQAGGALLYRDQDRHQPLVRR